MYPSREDAMMLFRELQRRGGGAAPIGELAFALGWSEAHTQNVLDLLELSGAVITFDSTEAHPPIFGPRWRLPEA
jgi:hypothetical protein